MAETGVSCEVAIKEAKAPASVAACMVIEDLSYDDAAKAHILEHVIQDLVWEVSLLRGLTPRDILADLIHAAMPMEKWAASLDADELAEFLEHVGRLREARDD